MTLKDEIRTYVNKHNNEVTNLEVQNFIQQRTNIKTTESSIRVTLYKILKEKGAILKQNEFKRNSLKEEVRIYLTSNSKNKNLQNITSADVVKCIRDKGYEATQKHIRVATSQVCKELGIKLKRLKS